MWGEVDLTRQKGWDELQHEVSGAAEDLHTLFITNRSDWDIPGPPFRGILSPPCENTITVNSFEREHAYWNVNYINNIICKFTRVIRREIVAATFNEEHLTIKFSLKRLQGPQIGRNVFANSGMWTAPSLDGVDSFSRQCLILDQKLSILPSAIIWEYPIEESEVKESVREDVIGGDGCEKISGIRVFLSE